MKVAIGTCVGGLCHRWLAIVRSVGGSHGVKATNSWHNCHPSITKAPNTSDNCHPHRQLLPNTSAGRGRRGHNCQVQLPAAPQYQGTIAG